MNDDTLPYRARQAINMTTTEAGQLVYVTRRTWEMWESGKVTMPLAKRELFIAKIQGLQSENCEMVVIKANDGITPIDVVASDGFCGIERLSESEYVVASLAVHRHNGRPYVHRQRFSAKYNEHIIRIVQGWKNVTR